MNPRTLKWAATAAQWLIATTAAALYGPVPFLLVLAAGMAGSVFGVAFAADGHVTYTPSPDTNTMTFICDDDEWVDTTDYPTGLSDD